MKKRNLALLAALPAAIIAANATADVEIYGKINVSMDAVDTDGFGTADVDDWQFNDNASRIGFRGSYDVNENLKAIYKLEYGVSVDGEADDHWTQRNIYGGFQSDSWGTFIAGQFDTPLKKAEGKVDLFNDTAADIQYTMAGQNRPDNILQWSSNELGQGFQVNVAFMPGESDNTGDSNPGDDDDFADYWSMSLTYDSDRYYAALAYDHDVRPGTGSVGNDIWRIVGQIKITDAVHLGLMYQDAEGADSGEAVLHNGAGDDLDGLATGFIVDGAGTAPGAADEQDAWLISLAWMWSDEGTFKFQYAESDNELSGGADYDLEQWTLGVDYALSKSTKVFALYTDWEADGSGIDLEADVLSMGFEHKF